MIPYYFKLAWLSIRATPLLSLLMVLIIAIGIATSMVAYTITYMMSKHPLEAKADTVFKVYLNAWNASRPYKEKNGKEQAADLLTYMDYTNLSTAHKNSKIVKTHTPVAQHKALIRTPQQAKAEAQMRYMYTVNKSFFTMFDSPFLYGAPWTTQSDEKGGLDVVISKPFNDLVFKGQNSVGKPLMIGEHTFTVSGVLDTWHPVPKYFDYASYAYNKPHDLYVPFKTQINSQLYLGPYFPIYCPSLPENITFHTILESDCLWLFLWVELNDSNQRDAYSALLKDYDEQQKQLGRFPRPINSYVRNISEHFVYAGVVPEHSKMAVWLAFAFLAVCLLNCMSLLVNKFYNKRNEIGLRRAIGASKQQIALQFGCETVLIGLVGGIFGLLLAQVGLLTARNIFHFLNISFMQMDALLVISTLILAVCSTCLFGLWPIYKAIKIQPSSQLKSL
ncbi:hypothetical protein PSECIP111854_00894 [Pseudoalteromonas sp. CIP111854]|uniref:ABC transporter permease n=1 Tax=Pseudoalteromonas holothuriae TaxID=2963714 RepID=A0A9W4QT62_9GAMM|nr:ABC transporter permease [Pseudoalteromonas sp. CIP111854]CAH9052073.1 hypothetical protein PSECIP111854_00894 [Pseudoalteromonas sp. CIP111854]